MGLLEMKRGFLALIDLTATIRRSASSTYIIPSRAAAASREALYRTLFAVSSA